MHRRRKSGQAHPAPLPCREQGLPVAPGGAMLPHAPQFFTQPETEDKATIAAVQKVAAKIGDGLKALKQLGDELA